MPRITIEELFGYDIGFKNASRPLMDERGNAIHDQQGNARTEDFLILELTDEAHGHRIVYAMPAAAKAMIIEGLTGGITVPTVHLPHVH